MKTITIDGEVYVKEADCKNTEIVGDTKIVILQRGWVMVGKFERDGNECKLHNASVIATWGTTGGLGEIAKDGPTSKTKLMKCNGLVQFDWLTVIATIACEESKWTKHL